MARKDNLKYEDLRQNYVLENVAKVKKAILYLFRKVLYVSFHSFFKL